MIIKTHIIYIMENKYKIFNLTEYANTQYLEFTDTNDKFIMLSINNLDILEEVIINNEQLYPIKINSHKYYKNQPLINDDIKIYNDNIYLTNSGKNKYLIHNATVYLIYYKLS